MYQVFWVIGWDASVTSVWPLRHLDDPEEFVVCCEAYQYLHPGELPAGGEFILVDDGGNILMRLPGDIIPGDPGLVAQLLEEVTHVR